MNTIFMVNKYI